jgi:O-antigen/teichoic acid export membrane protein
VSTEAVAGAAAVAEKPALAGHLSARVGRGLKWKAASTVVLQLLRFGTAMALARLLSPAEYGLAGMVLVFSSLVILFSDLSFGAALIQRERLTEADKSTVFWTSTGVGLLLTLLGVALSWPIAAFYGEPRVQPLCAALSLGFVVSAAASTQLALLTRDMDFRVLELRLIAAAAVSSAVGISLAAAGYGAWAIISQQLVLALVSTLLLWFSSPWRPRFLFSRASLRDLGGYSANVLGSRLLFYLNRNADNILVGRFLGAAALGAYQVGYNLMIIPLQQLAGPVQDVLFPAMSRAQDDRPAVAHAWIRANRVIGALAIPALAGLMVTAPDFVSALLGDKWHSAVPVIQVLAWVGLLQSVQGVNSTVLRALDRTNLLLRYSIIVSTVSLAAFICGLPFGVVGVAVAYAATSTVIEPYYTWLTCRAAEIPLRTFLGALSGVAAAAVVMAATVLAARLWMTSQGIPPLVRFGAEVLLGVAVYVPLVTRLAPELRREVAQALRRMRG